MKVQDYYFSINTTFHWRDPLGKSEVLISETVLPEALYTLQLCQRNDCTHIMKFKPLVGLPRTDLIGQKRAATAHTMNFLTSDQIIVSFDQVRPLIFDSVGRIVDDNTLLMR